MEPRAFCSNCYASLAEAAGAGRCLNCGRAFDPDDPTTFLRRPFPGLGRIIAHLIVTTLVGVMAAYVVAFFQLAGASGH
jgi:hypothetical protein